MFDNIPAEFLHDRLYNELYNLVEVEGTESVYLKHSRELERVDAIRV